MSDQLDRLFQVLVRRVRDVRPEHLSRPFEVSEILRTFAPYRMTRAEVGVETAEDYEVLILRLLSGERGYVFTDDAMQDDLRRELDSGNPDLRALHAYGTAKLTLAQHAMRQVLESSPVHPAAAPAAEQAAGPTSHVASATASTDAPSDAHGPNVLRDAEGRVVHAYERAAPTRAPNAAEVSSALEALQRQLPPTLAELGEAVGSTGEAKGRASFQPRPRSVPDPNADIASRSARPGCRFCGQPLPEGREVTFCPFCGQNLKVRRCPGCSAEMDPAWKFCVTCGRSAGAV